MQRMARAIIEHERDNNDKLRARIDYLEARVEQLKQQNELLVQQLAEQLKARVAATSYRTSAAGRGTPYTFGAGRTDQEADAC